jgi:hypothetical protein
MSTRLTIGSVLLLLLGVGAWSWLRPGAAESEAPAVVSERLATIPMRIGPWTGTDNDVKPKGMRIAEAEAYLSRTYRSEKGAYEYSVMILYGSPGGLGAHDPKTCYAGTGFEQKGSGAKSLSKDGSELWNARFERERPTMAALDVYWGWSTDGRWRAPDQPRLAFAGEGRIYKIYIQRAVGSRESVATDSSEFLAPFLHEVQKALAKPTG